MRFFRYMTRVTLLVLAYAVAGNAQLSGTKTVGTGGDYTTIAAAIAALNANGVSGPVVFSLTDAAYAETGATLLIKAVTNAPTAANTVTFKPAAGKSPVVTISGCSSASGANQYSGFTDSCTSYITIDGSNTASGATRDLTFQISDVAAGRNVVNIYGNCDNISIKNTKLLYQAIYPNVNAGDPTSAINVIGTAAGATDNFTIENCQIADTVVMPTYGVSIQGYITAPQIYGTSVTVKNNAVTSRWRGIYAYYLGAAGKFIEISGNKVTSPSIATSFSVYGIQLRTLAGTANVFNNKIVTLKSNAASSGSNAISCTVGSPTTVVNIYNNFIGDMVDLYTTTVPTAAQYAMSLGATSDSGTYNVYHNTIMLSSNCNTTGNVAGVFVGSVTKVTLKNNIIVNTYNTTSSYGIYKNTTTATLLSDYNDISTVSGRIGFLTVAQISLANWQTASAGDANSKTDTVVFVSSTDLHLAGASLGNSNLAGTTGLGITTDIDGDTRSATLPYMGADESITKPLKATGVNSVHNGLPTAYELGNNYPNPFNPTTQIRFALPQQSMAKLAVYDMLGREVCTLVDGMMNAGYFETTWNGKNNNGARVSSGMYMYRIEAGSFAASKKMLLLK